MKNVIIGIIGGFVLIYVTVISLSIYSKSVRENELNCTVSAVMKQTLKRYGGQKSALHQPEGETDEEVARQLTQEITRRLSSESEVQVDVKACDMGKGIISATVKERFSYPNGKCGTVQLDKTIIMDRKMIEESGTMMGLSEEGTTGRTEERAVNATSEPEALWEYPNEFYEEYADDLVFFPRNRSNGMIYCVTRENALPHHERLLGWKVEIRDRENQENVQNLFFQLGGGYMKLAKTSYDADYSNEYNLYGLSTINLCARLNQKAQELLNQGRCQIVFRACIAPVRGEIAEGTMNDAGKLTGTVSIGSEKEVKNLFYSLSLIAGEGIESVCGTGVYIYGTKVEIDAVLQSGYEFQCWRGKDVKIQKNFMIRMSEDVEWTCIVVSHHTSESDAVSGEIRFISKEYFEKDNQDLISSEYGGLSNDSCWVVNPEYRELLREVLSE